MGSECPRITVQRREKRREGGREEGEGRERKEGKRGKGKEEKGELMSICMTVMRLCSAVVKVTAFSQSPVLNPDSTLPRLSDP